MGILYVGIDLAKNVFAVHGVNEAGKPELVRPAVPRARLHELIASLPPCTVAMEACSGGHHWARLFAAHGHTVRLIAPKFIAPYRMSGLRGKNDAAEAEPGHPQSCGLRAPGEGPGLRARRALQGAAICEAVQRPSMRFEPVKSIAKKCLLWRIESRTHAALAPANERYRQNRKGLVTIATPNELGRVRRPQAVARRLERRVRPTRALDTEHGYPL